MDINQFRTPQSPWFFSQPPTSLVTVAANNTTVPKKTVEATPDNRFPGWAAPMEDGRLATDYRAHCEVNIPTGAQFATRKFMIANADALIAKSRKRQADLVGAGQPYAAVTDIPAQTFVKCDTIQCGYYPNEPLGVGVERVETTPPLFGTFAPSYPSRGKPAAPSGTTVYEGGRNSLRGVF